MLMTTAYGSNANETTAIVTLKTYCNMYKFNNANTALCVLRIPLYNQQAFADTCGANNDEALTTSFPS